MVLHQKLFSCVSVPIFFGYICVPSTVWDNSMDRGRCQGIHESNFTFGAVICCDLEFFAINYPVFDRIVTIDSMSLSPSQSFQSPYLRTRLLPSCWYSCKQKPSHQAHRPAEAKTCTLTDTTIRNPRVAKSQLFMSNSQIITQYSFSGLCKGFNVGKISCFKVICK